MLHPVCAQGRFSSRQRKLQLWQELNNIQQKDMSVSDYTAKIKSICDSLGSININVDEDEMVQVCLGGLTQRFNPLRTKILARETPPFFNLQLGIMKKSAENEEASRFRQVDNSQTTPPTSNTPNMLTTVDYS